MWTSVSVKVQTRACLFCSNYFVKHLELVELSSILGNIDLCVLFRTLFGPQAITPMPLRHSAQKPFIWFSEIQLPTSLSLPSPPDFQDNQNNLYIFIIQHEGNL
jgi:hypothetical protein